MQQLPYSDVLLNAGDYSDKDTNDARRMIVRTSMDCLIRVCGGRPTHMELFHVTKTKTIAIHCPTLRDNQQNCIYENVI